MKQPTHGGSFVRDGNKLKLQERTLSRREAEEAKAKEPTQSSNGRKAKDKDA